MGRSGNPAKRAQQVARPKREPYNRSRYLRSLGIEPRDIKHSKCPSCHHVVFPVVLNDAERTVTYVDHLGRINCGVAA
jgi:hypothetical protein